MAYRPTRLEILLNPELIREEKPICRSCSIQFPSRLAFLEHFTTRIGAECMSGPICPQCGLTFSSTAATREHMVRTHGGWWPRVITNFAERDTGVIFTPTIHSGMSSEGPACDTLDETGCNEKGYKSRCTENENDAMLPSPGQEDLLPKKGK